jgi:hypothetical protein
MSILDYIIYVFAFITILCIVSYVLSKDKRFLEIQPDKKSSGASTVNLIGTAIYGLKKLDREQLYHYGFNLSETNYVALATYKTKFISVIFPLIPLRTQIVFNEHPEGMSKQFYAIPVKMYWKQAFGILSVSYTSILIILIIMRVIWFS